MRGEKTFAILISFPLFFKVGFFSLSLFLILFFPVSVKSRWPRLIDSRLLLINSPPNFLRIIILLQSWNLRGFWSLGARYKLPSLNAKKCHVACSIDQNEPSRLTWQRNSQTTEFDESEWIATCCDSSALKRRFVKTEKKATFSLIKKCHVTQIIGYW